MRLREREEVKPKEMQVKEGISYTIGKFKCPHCDEYHTLHCKTKKENPTMRTRTKHWVK